jgi:hypothetical protein
MIFFDFKTNEGGLAAGHFQDLELVAERISEVANIDTFEMPHEL